MNAAPVRLLGRIMLIGQDKTGKTSLKKSLKGEKTIQPRLSILLGSKKTEIIIFCYLVDVFNNKPSLLNSIMF